ncbi:MAG: HIT family protein [Cruoricaptor ignavus]|nr:HIT family protein [Cruoricaptor ignavus]
MSSIFSKIVNGEIPAYKIAEDEHHLAFLDVMPLAKGHTLVIPKKEVDLIFDLDSEEYKNLWAFSQSVAKKIGAAIPCVRVGVAVVGLEVPHAHIHLVPLNQIDDLNFSNERLQLSPAEYQEIQNAIVNAQKC